MIQKMVLNNLLIAVLYFYDEPTENEIIKQPAGNQSADLVNQTSNQYSGILWCTQCDLILAFCQCVLRSELQNMFIAHL